MKLPNWFDKERQDRNRESKRQEIDWAKKTKGTRSAGSGSSWRRPQDNRTAIFLDQIKFTRAQSFRISLGEWQSLASDAAREGRDPRMVIEFKPSGITLIVTEA